MISRLSAVLLAVVASLVLGSSVRGQCSGDINGSGTVDGADLSTLLGAWGPCKRCASDLDADGQVSASDLALLLAGWGPCPPPWATVLEQAPDPAVVTNEAYRAAIVATGLPWRVRDNASQIELLLIPPGTFNMGCSADNVWPCNSSEFPVHTVTLTNAFYLGRYEVTQAQWQAVMGGNPSQNNSGSPQVPAGQVSMRPVDSVSWNMIQGFNAATGLRLPTEAEWEYAYRAGTNTAFHSFSGYPNGTNNGALYENIAWFYAGTCNGGAFCQTRPVGGKQANSLGLHDMSGNVWEWVNDWYGAAYYQSSPPTNPPGPSTGTSRVLRGGSYLDISRDGRASNRVGVPPANTGQYRGFRAARNP